MKCLRSVLVLTLTAVLTGLVCPALAQQPMQQPDMTIDGQVRSATIDNLIKLLNENYIFPETATKVERSLREKMGAKGYDNITSASKFAETLTQDVQSITHDKHLRVQYSSRPVPPETRDQGPSPEEIAQFREFARVTNCGFEKVERLSGNIGYLDLRQFAPAEMCGDTVAAAMNFLANADGVIIDIRHNGGGDPAEVALISSYLFDAEPVHLNDLYFRKEDSTHQWWTLPYVPGKRVGATKPVYVLTSNRTFSAAEEFTYNLKNLKRATIVGETTGGGANPGGRRRLGEHFAVFVPTGRAINPITKTNWEGVGVKPDVEVSADSALTVAHLAALKKTVAGITDDMRKQAVQQEIEKLQKELPGGEK